MKDSKFYKKQMKKRSEQNNKGWITKILLCVIVLLISLIVTNYNSDLEKEYKMIFLESNIDFTKINKVYEKYIGEGKQKDTNDDTLLTNSDVSIHNMSREETNGSYKIKVEKDYPVSFLSSGIIVYIGDKEEFKNTVIVQGNDGVDVWYSNVLLDNYSLYDYVKKGDILGTVISEELIITVVKDGEKVNYEDYFI